MGDLDGLKEIFVKGALPALLSMLLMIAGLLIHSPLAWIPIFLSLAFCITVFRRRVRQEIKKEIALMSLPMPIRPVAEVLDECDFLKPKP